MQSRSPLSFSLNFSRSSISFELLSKSPYLWHYVDTRLDKVAHRLTAAIVGQKRTACHFVVSLLASGSLFFRPSHKSDVVQIFLLFTSVSPLVFGHIFTSPWIIIMPSVQYSYSGRAQTQDQVSSLLTLRSFRRMNLTCHPVACRR